MLSLAQELLQNHGSEMTSNIILASVFQLPSGALGGIAEFLAFLMSVTKQASIVHCTSYDDQQYNDFLHCRPICHCRHSMFMAVL